MNDIWLFLLALLAALVMGAMISGEDTFVDKMWGKEVSALELEKEV